MHHSMMLLLCLRCCCLLIWCEWKRVDCCWVPFVCCFLCLHHSDWAQWVLCLISVHHPMMLLPFLQSRSLFFKNGKRVDCWWMSFVRCFFVYSTDWVFWVLCLISMLHSLMLLLRLQWCSPWETLNTNPWKSLCVKQCSVRYWHIWPSKSISLYGMMFIKRQTLSIVISPSIRPVINIKMFCPNNLVQWVLNKPSRLMLYFPFHPLRSFLKLCASWFLLFAASQISDSARSAHCPIPCPNAQHLASMSMVSASPSATQSSRSATAFGWFCGTPFPSISRIASSLFASMSPCPTRASSSSTLCAFTSFLSVIWVLFWVFLVLLFFEARKREREKKEKSKRKEEKGEKSCFFDLSVWAFGVAAFLFLLSPIHSSFLSLPCLLSLSFPSLFVNNTTYTDWKGGQRHKASQHIEPLPFSPFTSPLSLLLPSCVHQSVLSTLLHSHFSIMWCVWKSTWCPCHFGFTNTQHTLEWMEWVTSFALLCHDPQSPLCLFLIKHQPPNQPP